MTVSLHDLTIRYGEHVAVAGLTVTFERGSVGLLGRNGAGKSSVLKALLGLVRPTSGSMRFAELPPGASPEEIRAHVGYMPEREAHPAIFDGLVALLGALDGIALGANVHGFSRPASKLMASAAHGIGAVDPGGQYVPGPHSIFSPGDGQ